jgi:hypothetical protein
MTTADRFAAKAWTSADDDLLRSLAEDRMPARWIALRMERTPSDIRRRASRLNILLRPGNPQKQMMGG